MGDDLGALTLLGESADWLKDQRGVSIRDHRLEVLEAYRAAWSRPEHDLRHERLRLALGRLLDALRHNRLYPEAMILGRHKSGAPRLLPSSSTARSDFEHLREFCVVNKFGIGEVHLLYFVYLLCRTLHLSEAAPYDLVLEGGLGDVIFLRAPVYRADNLVPFSSELKARFHAVRILRGMKKLGLFGESPPDEFGPGDQAEVMDLLLDELKAAAAAYIQRSHRLAFEILDQASALEEHARAHAAGRAPIDGRSPEELFHRLRRRLRRLERSPEVGPALRERLFNLGTAAVVRALPHMDPGLGVRMYAFLRSDRYGRRVRHARMFQLLPNNSERLRFVNFLYMHGKRNPMYYVERFERHFGGQKLHFVRKEVGFTLTPQQRSGTSGGER